MAKLTKLENAWLARLQEVLDSCPSNRLGFYTTGDRDVLVYDRSKEAKINGLLDGGSASDFCIAVSNLNAGLGSVTFPSNIHSTAG